jgi:hypothetical protein
MLAAPSAAQAEQVAVARRCRSPAASPSPRTDRGRPRRGARSLHSPQAPLLSPWAVTGTRCLDSKGGFESGDKFFFVSEIKCL